MIKSNAWHKQLKIFFHKAKKKKKKKKHPGTYRDLMQVLLFGMRNALTIFSNVQAQIISDIPIKTIMIPS